MFKRKKTVPRPEGPLTEESLRQWLVDYLAVHVEIPREDIDTAKTFEAYGLDSRVAVRSREHWRRSSNAGSPRACCTSTSPSML